MPRTVTHRYLDPLDAVWLATAQAMGLNVIRDNEVFAATDGHGTLRLGTPETLDPDDCLAQMLLHEVCHWLVEGEQSLEHPDWGLRNEDERDLWRERATLRLQAALCDPHGLRWFLAPTTDHRPLYDALPEDPLEGAEPRVAARIREALERAERPPWAPHLQRALRATAAIAAAVHEAGAHRLVGPAPPLWALAKVPGRETTRQETAHEERL